MSSGDTYELNDPDLSNFINKTQFDRDFQNKKYFLYDIEYDITYGDKNSKNYHFIKDLINHFRYQQSQLGSGVSFVFLPSDPDELVDQLKLIVLEKVGGKYKPMLSERIVAIADKLLECECIAIIQHQNNVSASK